MSVINPVSPLKKHFLKIQSKSIIARRKKNRFGWEEKFIKTADDESKFQNHYSQDFVAGFFLLKNNFISVHLENLCLNNVN